MAIITSKNDIPMLHIILVFWHIVLTNNFLSFAQPIKQPECTIKEYYSNYQEKL